MEIVSYANVIYQINHIFPTELKYYFYNIYYNYFYNILYNIIYQVVMYSLDYFWTSSIATDPRIFIAVLFIFTKTGKN